jgi:hypothetical protein
MCVSIIIEYFMIVGGEFEIMIHVCIAVLHQNMSIIFKHIHTTSDAFLLFVAFK